MRLPAGQPIRRPDLAHTAQPDASRLTSRTRQTNLATYKMTCTPVCAPLRALIRSATGGKSGHLRASALCRSPARYRSARRPSPPSKQLLTHTQAAIGEQQFEQQRGCTPSEYGTSV